VLPGAAAIKYDGNGVRKGLGSTTSYSLD